MNLILIPEINGSKFDSKSSFINKINAEKITQLYNVLHNKCKFQTVRYEN